MSQEKISAVISLISAIVIVVASFFNWSHTTWTMELRMKRWPRALFAAVLVALVAALVLLVTA